MQMFLTNTLCYHILKNVCIFQPLIHDFASQQTNCKGGLNAIPRKLQLAALFLHTWHRKKSNLALVQGDALQKHVSLQLFY